MSTPKPNPAAVRSWEHRLSGGPSSLTAAFVQSLDIDTRLAPYDIAGSIAHAQMLSEVGLIAPDDAEAIRVGLEALRADIEAGRYRFDPAHEDVHMAIEATLIERIGEPGKRLHTARSRNDQVATDLRLWARAAIERIDGRLGDLQLALLDAAEAETETVMPGFTHVQHAQPVSAGQYFLAHVERFSRDRERLADTRRRVNRLPLGAGALAGSSLPINRRRVAELLGFDGLAVNSMDASCDRDFAVELVFDLAMVATHLSAWAEDWVLWASPEFGFVDIADAYCTSSSMMPQKKNPDVCELIRGRAAGAFGSLVAMLTLLKAQPMGYNRDLQEDKRHVFAAADLIEPAVEITAAVIRASRLRPERLRQHASAGFLDATSLAEYLVERGVPFREAHGLVARLVRECESRGLTGLADLPLEAMTAVCPRISADVFGRLGAAHVVRAYLSEGAAGVAQVRKQIDDWRSRLSPKA